MVHTSAWARSIVLQPYPLCDLDMESGLLYLAHMLCTNLFFDFVLYLLWNDPYPAPHWNLVVSSLSPIRGDQGVGASHLGCLHYDFLIVLLDFLFHSYSNWFHFCFSLPVSLVVGNWKTFQCQLIVIYPWVLCTDHPSFQLWIYVPLWIDHINMHIIGECNI